MRGVACWSDVAAWRASLNNDVAELELSFDFGSAADDEELERLARSLRAELLDLDVDAVEPVVAGPAPDDARAIEAVALGALIVKLGRHSETLTSIVRAVRAWAARDAGRRVRMELDGDVLELTGATDAERERLVDAWIQRHAVA